jgi:prepilin-type N-terminal cleavage/methylation domain-containing protein
MADLTAPRRPPAAGPPGFTLIELLIVLFVFGLILATLTNGFGLATKAWQRQERSIDARGDLAATQAALRQMIQSGRDFDGTAGELRFVGHMPAALDLPGLFDLDLKAIDGTLVVGWRRHRGGGGINAQPMTETELVQGVQDVAFGYYCGTAEAPTPAWGTRMDSSKMLILVRLDLRLPPGDPRRWPTLFVRTWIDISPAQA